MPIDKLKLSQMLRSGVKQKEIAQHFGVTEGAITHAKKELNINVTKNVMLENAHRAVEKNLNAVEQLQKINVYANELLDLLMRWNRGDKEALQILESQVRQVKVGQGEEVEWIKEYKMKDPRELALKAMAEIRQQLGLQLEIFSTLYDLQAAQQFQEEVLNIIGEVSPQVRDAIVSKLRDRRAIRQALKVS